MASKEIEIPTSVVNEEAYLKYINLKESKALHPKTRMIDTSDPHLVIDPLIMMPVIDKKISELPFTEREQILEKVKVTKILQSKMFGYKAEAYGRRRLASMTTLAGESGRMFLDERSSEVLGYFGRYLSIKEVAKIINVDWGVDITQKELKAFAKENAETITALQETFRKDTSNIRLSHKRGRLEELTFLYSDRKHRYEQTGARAEVDLMMKLIKQIKDEMHVNELKVSGEVTIKMQHTIAEHIEREIMGSLAINDIIIARAAFRLGINPAVMINRLHNSIYSRFTGFNTRSQDFMSEEVQYPSTMVYDWKMIEKKHDGKSTKDKQKEYAEFEEIPEEKKPTIDDIRAQMKAKLAKGKSEVGKIKGNLDKNSE